MNKSIKIFLNYFLGPLIFILLGWSLYKQIAAQPDLHQRWAEIKSSWLAPSFWLVVFLMIINWGIESLKWKLLIRPLEKFSFWKAFKSVLAGCSVTMLTPNRIGEYGGRILFVKEENRLQAIPLTILGSLSQLFVTVIMGTIGMLVFKYLPSENKGRLFAKMPELAADIFLWVCIIISVVLMLMYLKVGAFVRFLHKFKYLKKIVHYISVVDIFSRKQLLRILFLSFLRYMVFILQYMLLLKVMDVQIDIEICFWLLTIFYLMITLAPTIGFTELPVRAAASVELFQLYSSNVIGIQAASFGIWLINLVLPAIAGSVLIFGIKIMREK